MGAQNGQLGVVQIAESGETMKSQIIRIVIVVRAAVFVIISGATRCDDVVALEKPFDILKAMFRHIGMRKQNAAHCPIAQVGR